MRESDLARQVDAALEAAGWEMFKLSQDIATRKQLAGLPDRICVRRGHVVFIELKALGGQVRDSQVEFLSRVAPHLGDCVYYKLVDHIDGLPAWMTEPPRQ